MLLVGFLVKPSVSSISNMSSPTFTGGLFASQATFFGGSDHSFGSRQAVALYLGVRHACFYFGEVPLYWQPQFSLW